VQRLDVSGAVRPIYGSLGVKRLKNSYIWIVRLRGFAMFPDGYRLSDMRQQLSVEFYRGADKSLARPGRKQATFSAFYGTWIFITTFTRVHHLSIPQPNQSIPLPITLLTGAACFLPGRAKNVSAPKHTPGGLF
jgi:hypothetical protein